jgi:hypothetical protein
MRDNPDDLIDDEDLKELKDKYTIQAGVLAHLMVQRIRSDIHWVYL